MSDWTRCYSLLCETAPDYPSDLALVADMAEVCVKAERDRVLAAIEAAFPEFWAFEGDEEALRVVIAKLREVVS